MLDADTSLRRSNSAIMTPYQLYRPLSSMLITCSFSPTWSACESWRRPYGNHLSPILSDELMLRSYTDNPRNNPDAKPVFVVRDIEKVKQEGAFTYNGL